MLINDGIPTKEDIMKVTPSEERFLKGSVAIAECFQEIPCDPCIKACPQAAITMEGDINHTPVVDHGVCTGCGVCVSRCPGLAIFVIDKTYSEDYALVKFPFEYLPVPKAGEFACGMNRAGEELGWFEVVKVISGGKKNMTYVISLAVPKDLSMEIRNIKEGGYRNGR